MANADPDYNNIPLKPPFTARIAQSLQMTQERLQTEYQVALTEYHRLTNYLNAANGILTESEHKLLLDFVDLAKRKSTRLRRAITRRKALRS